MLVFIYDGSFEGIMTAIYESYYTGRFPLKLEGEAYLQQDMLAEYVHIKTCPVKADKVYRSIPERISPVALKNVYQVFLSNETEAATIIYEYLRLGYRAGAKLDLYLADDRVLKVQDIIKRVEYEAHKMFGFTRFQLIEGGVQYARIRPDNNILELIADHFADRFRGMRFIIHDVGRDLAVFYDGAQWILSQMLCDFGTAPDKNELEFRKLWKVFFDIISISSRENKKLQRQFVPRRYWDLLTELMPDIGR